MTQNIKHYTWSAINRFGIQTITFIGNILVARQLTPDDYGLVAMLSIVIAIAWNFTDSGFSDSLIRKNDATRKDFGTVLTFNIVVGAIMYLIIYITAPLIADYFQRVELIKISRIIGLSILVKAITVTEFTRLTKELKFKKTTLIRLVSNTVAVLIAYFMALKGFGYWALVFQTLTMGVSNIFLLLILNKWRPYLCFSKQSFREMSSYSFNLLITYFLNQIGNNLYSVIIGKYQSANILGYYGQAQKFKDIPIVGLNSIVMGTSYPLIARELKEIKRKEMYVSIFNKFLFLHFFITALLFGIANPIIYLLYGEKWLQTAPYFQLMLIAAVVLPIDTINSNIARVEGRAKLLRNNMFLKICVSLFALFLTMKESIEIILLGQIVSSFISAFINAYTCGSLIEWEWTKQLKIFIVQLWKPLLSSFIAIVISLNFNGIYIQGLFFIAIFLSLYILSNYLTKHKEFFLISKQLKIQLLKIIHNK